MINIFNVAGAPFFLHSRCSDLRHTDYANENKNYVCQYCTEYACLRCNKRVYDRQDDIYCDDCDFWIHRACAGLSRKEYENLQKYDSDEPWYCLTIDLSNNQISNIFQTKKKSRKHEDVATDIQCKKQKDCRVCNKRNCRIDKDIPQYTESVAN